MRHKDRNRVFMRVGTSAALGMLSLVCLLSQLTLTGQDSIHNSAPPDRAALMNDQSREMVQFFKAKENLYKQDWAALKAGLEGYLREYPAGSLTDEALYWTAESLFRLSKTEVDADKMTSLREEAVNHINVLVGRFPYSLWAKDALELRKKISLRLSAFGRSEYKIYLDPVELAKTGEERQYALMTYVGELTKEASFPILLAVYRNDPAPVVKRRALALLAQDYRMDALPVLQAAAAGDADETTRRIAAELIERVRMSVIPVSLDYYVYRAKSPAGSDRGRTEPFSLAIPRGPSDEKSLAGSIRSVLGLGATDLDVPFIRKHGLEYFGYLAEGFGVGAYSYQIGNSRLKKEPDRITGTVDLTDQKTRKLIKVPFSVDARQDQLIVVPRGIVSGGPLILIFLRFEPVPSVASNPLRDIEISGPRSAQDSFRTPSIGQMRIFAAEILSLGPKWSPEQLSNQYFIDLGPARAEIPGGGGTWVLEGMLLCDKKARQFIGRQFTLTDPQGKVVAKGEYVEVPADNPQSYRTSAGEIKSKTAVILSPELKNLAERRVFEGEKLLEFKVGSALSDSLAREVMKYDGTASIRDSEPASGEFDRIFKFSIDKAETGLKRLGDSYIGGIRKNEIGGTEFGDLAATQNRTTIPQRYTIAVRFEVFDGRTKKPTGNKMIIGYGVYNQRRATTISSGGKGLPQTGDVDEFEAKKLKKACDDAISQVTASLAKALSRL